LPSSFRGEAMGRWATFSHIFTRARATASVCQAWLALRTRAAKKAMFHKSHNSPKCSQNGYLLRPPMPKSRSPHSTPTKSRCPEMARRGMDSVTYASEGRPKHRGCRYDFQGREKRIKKGLFLAAPCFKNLLDAPP